MTRFPAVALRSARATHWTGGAWHIFKGEITYEKLGSRFQAVIYIYIPSGKLTYGKSPFSMGKPTISMAIFNSKLLDVITRGYLRKTSNFFS